LSTYDVIATINYKSTGSAIGDECEGEYVNTVEQYFENIGQVQKKDLINFVALNS